MPAEHVVRRGVLGRHESAGLESRVHLRRASGNGPTRGLSLPLATVTLDLASSRSGHGPTAAVNAVVLALVVALLDLERRATRGKVVTPMTRRRPT
jgi:hypothetical protein